MSSPTCQRVISKWSLDIYTCIYDRRSRLPCHHRHRPLACTIPIRHQAQSTQPHNLSNQSPSTHLHCHPQPKPPLPLTWKATVTPQSVLLALQSMLPQQPQWDFNLTHRMESLTPKAPAMFPCRVMFRFSSVACKPWCNPSSITHLAWSSPHSLQSRYPHIFQCLQLAQILSTSMPHLC